MNEWLALGALTALAVISPGADFAMVTRHSLGHGRAAGVWAATGVAFGVLLHVGYTLVGVAVLLRHSPHALGTVRLAGAAYLVWMGWRTCRAAAVHDAPAAGAGLSPWQALRTGFLTNALNPKTTLFVLSAYTQVVAPGTPMALQVACGAFMSAAHLVWFAAVALGLSGAAVRARVLQRQQAVNRGIGAVLMALGTWMALGG